MCKCFRINTCKDPYQLVESYKTFVYKSEAPTFLFYDYNSGNKLVITYIRPIRRYFLSYYLVL